MFTHSPGSLDGLSTRHQRVALSTLYLCVQGMLSIGCALLGASHVLGLEIDQDAIEVALDNVDQYEDPLPVSTISHPHACKPHMSTVHYPS